MLRWMLVAAAVVVLSGCSYAEKLSEIGAYVDLPRPQISGTFPMTDGMLVLRAEGVHGDFQWGADVTVVDAQPSTYTLLFSPDPPPSRRAIEAASCPEGQVFCSVDGMAQVDGIRSDKAAGDVEIGWLDAPEICREQCFMILLRRSSHSGSPPTSVAVMIDYWEGEEPTKPLTLVAVPPPP
jgi:hypothetical protein